jgi:sortase A
MALAGCSTIAWGMAIWAQAKLAQAEVHAQIVHIVEDRISSPPSPLPMEAPARPGLGAVIGWLEIPRLTVSLGVLEGDDARTLKLAAGHLPETPLPWDFGNTVVAGHRDTFFRALRGLRLGDNLAMLTARGEFRYRVTRLRVVSPQDVSVLHPGDGVALTLITCYPFRYVGPAPQRFVVHAARSEPGSG